MRKLWLLLALTACGPHRVDVSGEITVTHRIDLAVEWFKEYCTELYPDDEEQQTVCVNDLTAKFLEMLENTK